MQHVVVREFARLTTDPVSNPSMDQATLTETAFDWLCQENARLRKNGAPLVQIDGPRHLRLDNYVGVIETPCGTVVEILPKHVEHEDNPRDARKLLRKMLQECLSITPRTSGPSTLEAFSTPLNEWVMTRFLEALDAIVKRGVRFDYHAVREEKRYLRGRLDISRQVRQAPGRQHLFRIEHDIFDADRPENRLLRSALDKICVVTKDANNWRLSHELAVFLSPVPASSNFASDFRRWRDERLLAHYKPARPWCELILNEQTPLSFLGEWRGDSLLFPMERLFEGYVASRLRSTLTTGATIHRSSSSEYLTRHRGESWFQLKPDFLIRYAGKTCVLDTKWKLIDQARDDASNKYGLKQSDFYQLFAYAHNYLPDGGDLMLVYPKTSNFNAALRPFQFSDAHTLWVVPFDLERGELIVDSLAVNVGLAQGSIQLSDVFEHSRL